MSNLNWFHGGKTYKNIQLIWTDQWFTVYLQIHFAAQPGVIQLKCLQVCEKLACVKSLNVVIYHMPKYQTVDYVRFVKEKLDMVRFTGNEINFEVKYESLQLYKNTFY